MSCHKTKDKCKYYYTSNNVNGTLNKLLWIIDTRKNNNIKNAGLFWTNKI